LASHQFTAEDTFFDAHLEWGGLAASLLSRSGRMSWTAAGMGGSNGWTTGNYKSNLRKNYPKLNLAVLAIQCGMKYSGTLESLDMDRRRALGSLRAYCTLEWLKISIKLD
jgi:hypothetical protein